MRASKLNANTRRHGVLTRSLPTKFKADSVRGFAYVAVLSSSAVVCRRLPSSSRARSDAFDARNGAAAV